LPRAGGAEAAKEPLRRAFVRPGGALGSNVPARRCPRRGISAEAEIGPVARIASTVSTTAHEQRHRGHRPALVPASCARAGYCAVADFAPGADKRRQCGAQRCLPMDAGTSRSTRQTLATDDEQQRLSGRLLRDERRGLRRFAQRAAHGRLDERAQRGWERSPLARAVTLAAMVLAQPGARNRRLMPA
jgi:hypothetical protein